MHAFDSADSAARRTESRSAERARPLPRSVAIDPRAQKAAWRLELRKRCARLLLEVLNHTKRIALGHAVGVEDSLVRAWLRESDADRKTMPAYAIALLPKEERKKVLAAIGQWGDELEAGVMP